MLLFVHAVLSFSHKVLTLQQFPLLCFHIVSCTVAASKNMYVSCDFNQTDSRIQLTKVTVNCRNEQKKKS